MTDNQQKQEKMSNRIQVTLAVISLVGALGAAMFANWDKIFPSSQASLVDPNKTSSSMEIPNWDKIFPSSQASLVDPNKTSSSMEIPLGNYQLTCPTRSVKGETLIASCYDQQGRLQESSLMDFQRCTFGIENNDGRLVCRLDR